MKLKFQLVVGHISCLTCVNVNIPPRSAYATRPVECKLKFHMQTFSQAHKCSMYRFKITSSQTKQI